MSEIAESFASSLSELTVNSKPHINMLTMLAEDHLEFAPIITQTVLNHLQKVRPEVKLPVLYLIDSIVKNVGKAYINLFTQAIVQNFTNTFEKVDEKTREQMFKLRQTWSEVFPSKTIFALDSKVHQIDPAWPITAPPPNTVHLNPKFFKSDILDPNTLSSTVKQDLPHTRHHRKNKAYNPRSSLSHSSRSKKNTPPSSSVETTPIKPNLTPEQLREQMILKQKMLLELQQQKLKLELLHTQAKLEEQTKQLEINSNPKTSSELTKIQEKVKQEEASLKIMSKQMKKHVQMKSPKLQQIHRITSSMKAQKISDITKVVPEGLVKPSALLELSNDDINMKPAKPAKVATKDPKSKIMQIQALERVKAAPPAEPAPVEEAPLVRIAPVSSQLINAAMLSRNVRDPRLRQQFNAAAAAQAPVATPVAPLPTPPVKKPEPTPNVKSESRSKKEKEKDKDRDRDKKSSNSLHKERSKEKDEDSKSSSRSSSRSSERSSKSSNKEKLSPTKKSEGRSKSKLVDDLFCVSQKQIPLCTPIPLCTSRSHSPSKSHSKRDQTCLSGSGQPAKSSHPEKASRTESSPKRTKLQDNWQETTIRDNSNSEDQLFKTSSKPTLDIPKTPIVKQPEPPKPTISPELMDGGGEMCYEDIEKIVRHPDIVSKTIHKVSEVDVVEEPKDSPKFSDDSGEEKFDDIVKHPNKQLKFDKKTLEDSLPVPINVIFDMPEDNEEPRQIKNFQISVSPAKNVPCEPVKTVSETKPVDTLVHSNTEQKVSDKSSESTFSEMAPHLKQPMLSRMKDPRLFREVQVEEKPQEPVKSRLSVQEEPKKLEIEPQNKINFEEDSSGVDSTTAPAHNINENFIQEEIVSTQAHVPETEVHSENVQSQIPIVEKPAEESLLPPDHKLIPPDHKSPLLPPPPPFIPDLMESLPTLPIPERITLSPKKVMSPIKTMEPMDTIQEVNENVPQNILPVESPKKSERRSESPVLPEKKMRKGDKPSIMEQIIADAEKHEASPSPPPPPVISNKFKEISQSSLTRLRRVGRPRDDFENSESPEPVDVDLRTQIQPPTLTKDPKNEVLGLAEKDVDLRNLPASPTKKRPSMENLIDIPPAKKSKAEVMDELFGSEDVDLRPVLCPPPPSPPPPPIISTSPPPESAGEKLWARYKQTKPDTYKAKYTPSRRDRAPSIDKFGRPPRNTTPHGGVGWQGRRSSYQKDIDMRAQPPGGTDGSYNHIIMQAFEQHKRGDLDDDAYKRVLSEVFAMREKQQLEEAQRRDEEEAAQAENLEPISDEDISGGSLSGVEDAPSPSDSYTGVDDIEDSPKRTNETRKPEAEMKGPDNLRDVDIRVPPTDLDIRHKVDFHHRMDMEDPDDKNRKARGMSPYRQSDPDNERFRRREEVKAQRRERKSRREEERGPRGFRKNRYGQEPWTPPEGRPAPTSEPMEVDAPRVPPLTHYEDGRTYREPLLSVLPPRFDNEFTPEQHDSPPMRPGPWEPQRMPGPGPGPTPWMPNMGPLVRGPVPSGPPPMTMRPPDRFMLPRWRQPGPAPMFEGEHGPRFNRFAPPPIGRFPVPLAPCEVPPTDPTVLKIIEEDPTKSINIDGVPRDIRFYGIIAVALMSWDDPREVSFQPGQRRVIIDDRDSFIVHFNAPPIEILIDGQPHRIRFGAPTRELYIDNQWYEIFFGGPAIQVDIGGKTHSVKLEGPPPPVRPGVQRKDLVVGKVALIIDAEYLFTIYLDAKPQKFEVKGISYIIRFVEALQKTVINGVAFKSDFGGLLRPIILNGTKHFFRLTALPRGVTPGYLTILNMEGGRLPSPPTLPAPPQLPASLEKAVTGPEIKSDVQPHFLQPPMGIIPAPTEMLKRDAEAPAVLPPTLPVPVVTSAPPVIQPPPLPPVVNPLDMLTTLMPAPEPSRAVDYSYSVDEGSNQSTAVSTTTTTTTTTSIATAPTLTGEINVAELLQKLMATGIVPTLDQAKDKNKNVDKPVIKDSSIIKPVDFRKPETLKTRQTALISHLYSGIQCNSCGVRFPPEQTMRYSQHLDWHFRQNRRDKDSSRTAQTRRYYYDVSDWVQFEEIEDLEERAQPWFEIQEGAVEEEEVPQVMVSVRSADYPDEESCNICHDKFESFYNEEKEEWHLRNAMDHEGKLVHPICLEDQKAAAEKPIIVEDIDITEDDPKEEGEEEVQEVKEDEKKEEKVEEDDDIMEVTDIEFIKPVFPVEDLTVSDSESVIDEEEKKDDIEVVEKEENEEKTTKEPSEEVAKEEAKDEEGEAKKEEIEDTMKPEEISKDEDTQDDLVLLDKGDEAPSTTEIMEVVRNIKKDPDTLGGEYEEIGLDPDIEVKKEKGEVPLPTPVVDTTHTTVTCLIDGNVEFEETPQQLTVGGPPKIKINITKPNVQPAPKEVPKESEEVLVSETANAMLPASLALVNQPLPPGEEPVPNHVKPKIRESKLQEFPPVRRGHEMSGLCSIM